MYLLRETHKLRKTQNSRTNVTGILQNVRNTRSPTFFRRGIRGGERFVGCRTICFVYNNLFYAD